MSMLGTNRATVASFGLAVVVVLAALSPLATATVGGQATPETDNTVTRIQVHADGSATWTVQIRTRLDTDQRVSDYRAFQDRFRRNTSRYLDPFRERIRGVVANAANATGREMRAVNFTASTSVQEVPRRWGVVTYRFTWTEFADAQDQSLVVGDVFEGGFFLAANDTLEVEAPPGYEVTSVDPAPADREAGTTTWVGREDFDTGRPRVAFAPVDRSTGPPPTAPAGDDRGLWLGSGILVGLLLVGAYVVWNRRNAVAGGGELEDVDAPAPDGAAEATAPPMEPEILTDAERVQAVLEAHGGRMKQAAIADELDWSASKTSRVLADMVEDGTVEKLQLGRENLVDLADREE